jgi:hypothetical protein
VTVFETPVLQGGSAGHGGVVGEMPETSGDAGAVDEGHGGSVGAVGAAAGTAGAVGAAAGSDGLAGEGGAAGNGAEPDGTPCTDDTACLPGWHCEKTGCDAPSGVCEPKPVFLPPEPAPVCGCDGITYWNDALRRQHGAVLDAPGECRASACSCAVGADCKKEGASCSHLVAPGEMCGQGTGTCWVLPSSCLPYENPLIWRECGPSAPMPPVCVDTCAAIRSERPHVPPYHTDCK